MEIREVITNPVDIHLYLHLPKHRLEKNFANKLNEHQMKIWRSPYSFFSLSSLVLLSPHLK